MRGAHKGDEAMGRATYLDQSIDADPLSAPLCFHQVDSRSLFAALIAMPMPMMEKSFPINITRYHS
jgi:hypothetical protein